MTWLREFEMLWDNMCMALRTCFLEEAGRLHVKAKPNFLMAQRQYVKAGRYMNE